MAHVYIRSGAGGSNNGSSWANAYTTLIAATAAKAAGDQFWVSEDHSETTAGNIDLAIPGTSSNPNTIICASHSGSVPPVAADFATTAVIAMTGSNRITFNGCAYIYGITFNCGSSTNTGLLWYGLNAITSRLKFEACKMVQTNTGTGSTFQFGTNSGTIVPQEFTFYNTTFKFAHIGQSMTMVAGKSLWYGTASGIDSGGSIPTTLIIGLGGSPAPSWEYRIEGVDLSYVNTTLFSCNAGQAGSILFKDCKVNSSAVLSATPSGIGTVADFYRCTAAANNYQISRVKYEGSHVVSTTVKRTSGLSVNSTGLSWKIITTANANLYFPFTAQSISIPNGTTGSNVTVTVEGIADPTAFSALPTNAEFWWDVEYLGDASSGVGTFKSTGLATVATTATAATASTQAWDTGAVARVNTTAYTAGVSAIKTSSNTGRVFFCTTSGTSAGSEPGGYASAVDGGSVTDGSATFKAGWRFKQAVTLSSPQPAQIGSLYVYPKMAIASATVYLDPKITLS